MKKFVVMVIVLMLFAVVGSVHAQYGAYDMTGEFTEFIESNPIDKDYKSELDVFSNSPNFSAQGFEKLETKYEMIWDKELNVIYQKLLKVLNKDEQEMLRESQRGWLQHHIKEQTFVRQVFDKRKSGPILGSQGRVQKTYAMKDRIRQRTFELMEYYHMLGYKVAFVYQKQK